MATAGVHSEIPARTFPLPGRSAEIAVVGITLIKHPAGAINGIGVPQRMRKPVVQRGGAVVNVIGGWSEPSFECERNARIRVVLRSIRNISKDIATCIDAA